MIVAFPAATPVTTPEAALTVATVGSLLLQVPPVFPPLLVNVVAEPLHTVLSLTVPAFGSGFTIIVMNVDVTVAHTGDTWYLIVTVPGLIPFTTPLTSTTATDGSLLVQVPPGVPLVIRFICALVQTADGPVIVPAVTAGLTFTVTDSVAFPQEFGTE